MTEPDREVATAPPDQEWFVLTEGMDPYERFRYIAQHVLENAVDEAITYVDDARIFEEVDLDDEEAVEAHLRELDEALREDDELTQLEREFLCAAVSRVMREHDMKARCYGELLRFARPAEDAGNGDGCA